MKKIFSVLILFLFVSTAFANNVSLQWSTVMVPDVVGYYVYRATSSGGYNYSLPVNTSPVPQSQTSTVAYTDSTAPNAQLFYVVRAVNSAGVFSASSNEVMTAPLGPPAPTGLTVLSVTATLYLSVDGNLVAMGPSPLNYTIPRQTPPKSYAVTVVTK